MNWAIRGDTEPDDNKQFEWVSVKEYKKLAKYKRAFEILKDKLNIEFGKYDFSVTPNYYKDLEYFADVKSSFDLTKEEAELLEELMNNV